MNIGILWKRNDFYLKLLLIIIGVYLLAILQDFIYSELKSTGFYLSESALFNLYWMFFLPIILFYKLFIKQFSLLKNYLKIILIVVLAFLLAIIQAFVFTGFFIGVSHLVYDEPHRFQAILRTAISNQFYLTVIIYIAVPLFLLRQKGSAKESGGQVEHILVKNGVKTERLEISQIIYLKSDKPYISIITTNGKYLDSSTLQGKLKNLDSEVFIRVHRSAIINKNQVASMISRKNGDFDAEMSNGDEVRLSRHYRSAWESLLH